MTEEFFPILGKAEILAYDSPYSGGGFPKEEIRSFDEARERLTPQIENILNVINRFDPSERLDNSVFFCMDLDFSFIAKSYLPFNWVQKLEWNIVGSIAWKQIKRDKTRFQEQKKSRRLFFKAHPQNIESALTRLKDNKLNNTERNQITRVDSLHMQDSQTKKRFISPEFDKGIVELILHPMEQREWQECLKKLKGVILALNYPRFLFDWVRGGGVNNPRFLPVQVDFGTLDRLANFNPLRSMRVMPRISYPRINLEGLNDVNPPPTPDPMRAGPLPRVGVFDGGVDMSLPHLASWVTEKSLTSEPPDQETLEHGTAVCSALFYGPYDPKKSYPSPKFGAHSFRVFPVPEEHGINLDLYKVIDWIEGVITNPDNFQIKTFVLSFGPNIPVDDDEVDLFTSTLDRLAYEYDVMFIVAAGNSGDLSSPYNRIQPPSDMVNGIGVGAYVDDHEGKPIRAGYSCIGPGRCGNAIKPDVHMFGGDTNQLFSVLVAGKRGKCAGVQGTSFAAPLACSLAGNLLYRVPDQEIITPQTVKALLIHNAFQEGWEDFCGWGPLSISLEDILYCTQNNVTLIYNGYIPFGRRGILKIPFYQDILDKGQVRFRWTLVHATGVSPAMPDEYTLSGTDVTFRPHCDVFTYEIGKKQRTINISTDSARAIALEKQGAKFRKYPKTDSFFKLKRRFYPTEQERRDMGVWDTVKHYWTKNKLFRSVKNPVIEIHAQARAEWYYGASKPSGIVYAAVVSIEVSRAEAQLYQRIRAEIPELVQVRLRTRAHIRQ